MNDDAIALESDQSEFVEVDPTGRYGRYNEILGKGASKTVYRAFDEYEGIEVAWNKVKLYDFLQNPEDLERLYCEIHLLKTLNHRNIMKFYTSWVDPANRNINFVTEMFTSGTLRQYRLKHKRVNIRAVKQWCRQILEGLVYLHSHDPPVIHRDLKCDNIFINGNQGEVKIGDLGLATINSKSHSPCVGTLEFMAPEVYEQEYNELVDIYSFGMCVLELVTCEYPYSECTHPVQIYKKVISGKKPETLHKVDDPEVRQFIEKCLTTVCHRLSARELLLDPFLQIDDNRNNLKPLEYCRDFDEIGPLLRQPLLRMDDINMFGSFSNSLGYEPVNDLGHYYPLEFYLNEIDLFASGEDGQLENAGISIKGRREDDGIFLRLRITDQEGRVQNIYFPFDLETDTALTVATEMVAELDIADQCVTKIADMIDGEIASFVPDWESGMKFEEEPRHIKTGYSQNDALKGSVMDRYEGSEQCATEGAPVRPSKSGCAYHTHIWREHGGPELYLEEFIDNHLSDECDRFDKSGLEFRDEHLVLTSKSSSSSLNSNDTKQMESSSPAPLIEKEKHLKNSFTSMKHIGTCVSVDAQKIGTRASVQHYEAAYGCCSPQHRAFDKSFCTGALLPYSFHRGTSLPVEAINL